MAHHAAMAIEAGLCDTSSASTRATRPPSADCRSGAEIRDGDEDFEEPYGLLGAVANARLLRQPPHVRVRHHHEQFGAIAVATRKHACLNANATMRKPITLEDHQNSRWIVEPLRLLDCSLVSDGGGASSSRRPSARAT